MSRGTEVFFEYQKGLTQFVYFQLGVAASAMAFAVHETSGQSLEETPWPIGLAVIFWALSFVAGCWASEGRLKALNGNARYLLALEEVPPAMRTAPGIVAAIDEAKNDLERDASKQGPQFRWQLRLLFLGAVAFIWGHVMEMAGLSNPSWMIG